VSKRIAQVFVLAEDKQQRSFVERLLKELGYPPRKLRPIPLPAGEGSGEQHVREQYPIQVQNLRPQMKFKDVALVAIIDADKGTVMDRQKQLAEQLDAAKLDPRGPREKIVHLIPCRNVETWIHYLLDKTAVFDEESEYPKFKGRERECQKAVEELAQLCKSNEPLPANCLPSLVAAIGELKRLG
jgi:hypothetical protein